MANSDFFIGNIPVYGNRVLAPMNGISDQPFRWLCRYKGSSVTYTEFINILDVPRNLKDIDKRTKFSESERPIGFQLYGRDPKKILHAAKILLDKRPDFFDLNIGCSVRRIAGRGAGAGLLKEPDLVEKIISNLVKNIKLPITAKIRLGWDRANLNYKELSRIIESAGAAMITVHARTRDENLNDAASWNAIKEIKEAVRIPVIGNGGIHSQKDIQEMINQTECDGVMIGRAAIGNPWIFSDTEKSSLTSKEIINTIKTHWLLMIAFYGPKRASILFKKHIKAYLSCSQFTTINLGKILSMPNPMNSKIFYK